MLRTRTITLTRHTMACCTTARAASAPVARAAAAATVRRGVHAHPCNSSAPLLRGREPHPALKSTSHSLHRTAIRTLFIQTQETPNPHAKKFFPGQAVVENGGTYVFNSKADTAVSPLARNLFHVEGVNSLMFGGDFITVNKKEEYTWEEVNPEVFATIMDFFASGAPVIKEGAASSSTTITDEDDDVVAMVKELLETRIKPVIHEDGGDIEFVKMENGTVYVKLHGACGTCPSSTATLKGGIENMLMHYVPEVEAVEQVFDEADIAGQEAFEDLEKKLEQDAIRKHLSH